MEAFGCRGSAVEGAAELVGFGTREFASSFVAVTAVEGEGSAVEDVAGRGSRSAVDIKELDIVEMNERLYALLRVALIGILLLV